MDVRDDGKCLVGWVNGLTKQANHKEMIERVPREFKKQVWDKTWDLSSLGEWAKPIFRKHNAIADTWAELVGQGEETKWDTDVTHLRNDIESICGFWDGSCQEETPHCG